MSETSIAVDETATNLKTAQSFVTGLNGWRPDGTGLPITADLMEKDTDELPWCGDTSQSNGQHKINEHTFQEAVWQNGTYRRNNEGFKEHDLPTPHSQNGMCYLEDYGAHRPGAGEALAQDGTGRLENFASIASLGGGEVEFLAARILSAMKGDHE